ncbi:hypothetical protein AAGG74_17545 [Bacillus mexicanus]|uniref:hypothetical protein n=1 Tax=Bacillus mexicanus TaxID=2834415 RepID=UPI003D195D3D
MRPLYKETLELVEVKIKDSKKFITSKKILNLVSFLVYFSLIAFNAKFLISNIVSQDKTLILFSCISLFALTMMLKVLYRFSDEMKGAISVEKQRIEKLEKIKVLINDKQLTDIKLKEKIKNILVDLK